MRWAVTLVAIATSTVAAAPVTDGAQHRGVRSAILTQPHL